MAKAVRTRIVRIGNSRGVRIPKLLLDQTGLGEEVELVVQRDRVVIRPVQRARSGWEEQFRIMAERGDDRLLEESATNLTRWDADEWEWT
jgi:antitoxin MazE